MTSSPPGSSLVDLARSWLVISTQSIGGGPSVLLLMRRLLVERHRWLTHRQFLEDYAISKMSLGINLIALAGLIGWRAFRLRGTVVSVLGLVVPAGFLTIVITLAYLAVREEPLMRAAVSGAGPAAAGLTIGTGYTFARQSVRRGWRSAIDYAYAAIALGLALFAGTRPLVIILIGAVVGAIAMRGEPSRASADPAT